jgi:hypothetical protein
LDRWKIYVHCGVDAYSRRIMFIGASNNNRASTVKHLFIEATQLNGIPGRVRMDCGGENEEVKDIMNLHHGPGRGSAIQGRSVHNVRVERSWCDAKKDALQPFRDLLVFLCAAPEESGEGLVDMTNQNHIWAIHYVFLPKVNYALQLYQRARNDMGLRTEGNRTPNQLFVTKMMEQFGSMNREAVSFWEQAELNLDQFDNEEQVVDYCPLSAEGLDELRAQVDPEAEPTNEANTIAQLREVLAFLP